MAANVEIDDKEFRIKLKELQANFDRGVPKAVMDVGFELMRLSQLEVPHDEGTLQNSGTVEADGKDVVVGYHTPYAARLHEHPEYKYQRGRKGKYLEDPLRRNQQALGIKGGISLQKEIV